MSRATDIAAWIKLRGNYAEGLALLNAAGGTDEDTAEFLELGETEVTRRTLEKELQGILDEAVARTKEASAHQVVRVYEPLTITPAEERATLRDPRNDGYAQASLTPEQSEVHASIKRDLKERDYLRHRLELLSSDKDRLRDAMRIDELDQAIQSAYARLDAWVKFGADPDAGTNIPEATTIEKMRELRNIRTYLSRHKTGQRKLSEAKHAHYAARLAALQSELEPDAAP